MPPHNLSITVAYITDSEGCILRRKRMRDLETCERPYILSSMDDNGRFSVSHVPGQVLFGRIHSKKQVGGFK